jgi:hypothetical protein
VFSERYKPLRVGIAGAAVLFAWVVAEERSREGQSVDGVNTASNVGVRTEEVNEQRIRYDLEAGELRARATAACEWLSPQAQDRIIAETTGLAGREGFLEYRRREINGETFSNEVPLATYRRAIFVGCLQERDAEGDQEAAQRIARMDLE